MEKTSLAMRRRSTVLENDHASRSPDHSTAKVGPSNTSTIHTAQDQPAPAALQGRVPAAPPTDNTGRLLDSYAGIPQVEQPIKRPTSQGAWEGGREATLDDFKFLATIGTGNYAKVLLAEANASKRLYAVKILKKKLLIEGDEFKCITQEKQTLLTAARESHPFIVRLYSMFQTERRVYFVMEYLPGGDLMFHIQRRAQYLLTLIIQALSLIHI